MYNKQYMYVDRKYLGLHLPSQVFQIKFEVGTFSYTARIPFTRQVFYLATEPGLEMLSGLRDKSFCPSVLRLIYPRSLIPRIFELFYLFYNPNPLRILFAYILAAIL